MAKFQAELRSLAGGSLPHIDPEAACRLVADTLSIPTWPQLPKRSFLENMYVQFSEGFPGVVVADEQLYVNRDDDLDAGLERLYVAYLTDDLEYAAISPRYAAGLHCFLALNLHRVPAVKGQVTGPLSWSLLVVDEKRVPIMEDDVLTEAISKHLRLKAAWMERELRKLSPQTIILVDEPYLSSLDSDSMTFSRAQATLLLQEVFAGIQGLKGIHCCGLPDWSLILPANGDILSLDAYDYPGSLAEHAEAVDAFLKRGGIISWGMVPADDRVLDENVESLVDRFLAAIDTLVVQGLHRDDLLAAALIMPSCGAGSLPLATAERVLALTHELSNALRERYA
ncbi:MAG TPA: methionine synthase [Anaerolineae bacterium]|nr:methionine synthase [Anaerolineae bacterium]